MPESRNTQFLELRFRDLLTESDAQEMDFELRPWVNRPEFGR
jgi:hypothetical protein